MAAPDTTVVGVIPGALTAPGAWRAVVGRWIGIVIFHTAYRGEAHGTHFVPMEGPIVFVANHSGFLDGPVVFSMTPRPAHFLVKKHLFGGAFGLLRLVGQIPIDRTGGDRDALGTARAVLAAEGAVGVFPEGTRGRGDVQQVNQGATWLALQAGARVVPVACLGTRRTGQPASAWPRIRSRLVIAFGEPFDLTPDPALAGPGSAQAVHGAAEGPAGSPCDRGPRASGDAPAGRCASGPRRLRDNGWLWPLSAAPFCTRVTNERGPCERHDRPHQRPDRGPLG